MMLSTSFLHVDTQIVALVACLSGLLAMGDPGCRGVSCLAEPQVESVSLLQDKLNLVVQSATERAEKMPQPELIGTKVSTGESWSVGSWAKILVPKKLAAQAGPVLGNSKMVCADDKNWRDNKYGNGRAGCTNGDGGGIAGNSDWCFELGDYSKEARKFCPVSCGTCGHDEPDDPAPKGDLERKKDALMAEKEEYEWKKEAAIKKEDFETAATIRDQLKKVEKHLAKLAEIREEADISEKASASATDKAVAKCLDGKFGQKFCSEWCGVSGVWSCGVNTLGFADLRNDDKVDYTCSCSGCPKCQAKDEDRHEEYQKHKEKEIARENEKAEAKDNEKDYEELKWIMPKGHEKTFKDAHMGDRLKTNGEDTEEIKNEEDMPKEKEKEKEKNNIEDTEKPNYISNKLKEYEKDDEEKKRRREEEKDKNKNEVASVSCSCTTPNQGAEGFNGYRCTDGTSGFCQRDQHCMPTTEFALNDLFKSCQVTCSCLTPNAGTAGKNGYKCSDSTNGWCPTNQHCVPTTAFPKYEWNTGCQVPNRDSLPDTIPVEQAQAQQSRVSLLHSKRLLAEVTPPGPMKVDTQHVELKFLSAVPTFGPHSNYIALIHRYNETIWDKLNRSRLYCSGRNKSHQVEMRFFGGEAIKLPYKRTMVWQCDWPKEEAHNPDFDVYIQDSDGNQVGQLRTSYNRKLLKNYKTVVCVPPVFYGSYDTRLGKNSTAPNAVRMLPSWMEYNLMHGVDHFLFYTFDDTPKDVLDIYKPYLDANLASRVHMKIPEHIKKEKDHYPMLANSKEPFNSGWVSNDCLYRTKEHANWVLSTMDVDEFLRAGNGSFSHATYWDSIAKNASKKEPINQINFGGYAYAAPQNLLADPLISSSIREEKPQHKCRKYIFNPALVNVLFVHWPSSFDNNSVGIAAPMETVAVNHYRLLPRAATANFTDTSLVGEEALIREAVERRFMMPYAELHAKLDEKKKHPSLLQRPVSSYSSPFKPKSKHGSLLALHSRSKLAQEFADYGDPDGVVAAWTEKLNKIREVQTILPPGW